jgi:hypothetical protein
VGYDDQRRPYTLLDTIILSAGLLRLQRCLLLMTSPPPSMPGWFEEVEYIPCPQCRTHSRKREGQRASCPNCGYRFAVARCLQGGCREMLRSIGNNWTCQAGHSYSRLRRCPSWQCWRLVHVSVQAGQP